MLESLLGLAASAARQGDLAYAARLASAASGHVVPSRNVVELTVWARLDYDIILRGHGSATDGWS